jgi:hypothetical protein
MAGTLSVPPPMPIIEDTAPMLAGISAPAAPAGGPWRSTTRSSGSSILSPEASATTPNTIASTRPSSREATNAPASAPITTGTDQRRTMSRSIEPRRACEREDDSAVGTIVAIEVATAMCRATEPGTPAAASAKSSAGTMTMPPPTPSSPASNPPMAPAPTRAASIGNQSAYASINPAASVKTTPSAGTRTPRAVVHSGAV